MKRTIRWFATMLVIALLSNSFVYTVYAKDLEYCRLCSGNGKYHCHVCNNAGEVTCDGCGGVGGSKCVGGCNGGYLSCTSCNGDGKMRSGDGTILNEGVCGNCNGVGTVRCIRCAPSSVPGQNICTRCNGAGKMACQSCPSAREIGYKCPKCKGTGYILVGNPMPPEENNDGIHNIPVKGDHITIDVKGHYIVYGQEDAGTDTAPNDTKPSTEHETDEKNTMPPTNNNHSDENISYTVNFGDGSWTIDNVKVTATINGTQTISETDTITLTNFNAKTMEVWVFGIDDFGTMLTVTNGQTSLSTRDNVATGGLPNTLTFSIVLRTSEDDNFIPDNNDDTPTEASPDNLIPNDRNSNFEIPPATMEDSTNFASAFIEVAKMSAEEHSHYASLTADELNRKLINIQMILDSAHPGFCEACTEEFLRDIATQNGYNTLEEGKIFPLYFEGHETLGFPIAVTVRLEKGVLEGGTDLYVYHILEDKSIEALGKAEYRTYDEGSIESITFYTTSFSTFFTSKKELDSEPIKDEGNEPQAFPENLMVIVLVVVVVMVSAITFLTWKRKKSND